MKIMPVNFVSAVECDPLDLPNGNVTISGNNSGDSATYLCDEGYTLVGDGTRICQLTGNWTGTDPICYCKPLYMNKRHFTILNV